VLGNGTSRNTISLDNLNEFGTVYGCNALYRDYIPNYLVAVDAKMVMEINRFSIQDKTQVWTNPNKAFATLSKLNYFTPSKGWSSGPTALHLASEHAHDTIKQDRATFYGNWLRQTTSTILKNPKKRYIRVLEDKGFTPKEFNKLENLEHISVNDFKELFVK
jgi:hypothetical protein